MKTVLIVATVQSHVAQFHRPLAEVLHRAGWTVHVAARDNLALKNGLKLDFADRVFDVPFSRSPKSWDNVRAYKQLKAIIDHGDYAVVHCNTPMGGVVTRLAARAARGRGTKVFYTAHGFHFYNGSSRLSWMTYYPIERWLSRFTDKLITITHEDYDLASKKFYCQVVHTHGVGVDENRYMAVSEQLKQEMRLKMGFDSNQKIILCIGELNANKSQSMAIRMMHRIVETYPSALLLLAGNGPLQAQLEQLIASEGLTDNVRMLGYVTNLQDYQHIVDVQVCCSKREGLPLNVVESMLSGNPVVATNNRGHRELISDGETGFLVSIDDSATMAERVLNLLNDNELRGKIVAQAFAFAAQYTFTNVKKELQSIYNLNS